MGRPHRCNCHCEKCYITSFVIAIYDESISIYTGEPSVYNSDLETWNSFTDEVRECSGQKIRLGLMAPGPLSQLKYDGSEWPHDTDRDSIDRQEYPVATPRLSAADIVGFFDTMLGNPTDEAFEDGPLLLLFVLDNSGSIELSQYAEELAAAKSILKARFPTMKILDDISSSGERWLNDAYDGIRGKICEYTCCEADCFNDISIVEYDPLTICGTTEEEFEARKLIGGPVNFSRSGMDLSYISSQVEIDFSFSQINSAWYLGSTPFPITIDILGDFSGTYPSEPILENQYEFISGDIVLRCYNPTFYMAMHRIRTVPAIGTYGGRTYNGYASLSRYVDPAPLELFTPFTLSVTLFADSYTGSYDIIRFSVNTNLNTCSASSLSSWSGTGVGYTDSSMVLTRASSLTGFNWYKTTFADPGYTLLTFAVPFFRKSSEGDFTDNLDLVKSKDCPEVYPGYIHFDSNITSNLSVLYV
jgi:hypothetical protein